MTYNLNDTGRHFNKDSNLAHIRNHTSPGMVWLERDNYNELIPDFMLEGCRIEGHWRAEDVKLYGVTFEDFERFVNQLGYEVVYNN